MQSLLLFRYRPKFFAGLFRWFNLAFCCVAKACGLHALGPMNAMETVALLYFTHRRRSLFVWCHLRIGVGMGLMTHIQNSHRGAFTVVRGSGLVTDESL
jgi:hypothetical protein